MSGLAYNRSDPTRLTQSGKRRPADYVTIEVEEVKQIIVLSLYALTNVYGDLGFWFMARSRMLYGVGLPLVFVSITTRILR